MRKSRSRKTYRSSKVKDLKDVTGFKELMGTLGQVTDIFGLMGSKISQVPLSGWLIIFTSLFMVRILHKTGKHKWATDIYCGLRLDKLTGDTPCRQKTEEPPKQAVAGPDNPLKPTVAENPLKPIGPIDALKPAVARPPTQEEVNEQRQNMKANDPYIKLLERTLGNPNLTDGSLQPIHKAKKGENFLSGLLTLFGIDERLQFPKFYSDHGALYSGNNIYKICQLIKHSKNDSINVAESAKKYHEINDAFVAMLEEIEFQTQLFGKFKLSKPFSIDEIPGGRKGLSFGQNGTILLPTPTTDNHITYEQSMQPIHYIEELVRKYESIKRDLTNSVISSNLMTRIITSFVGNIEVIRFVYDKQPPTKEEVKQEKEKQNKQVQEGIKNDIKASENHGAVNGYKSGEGNLPTLGTQNENVWWPTHIDVRSDAMAKDYTFAPDTRGLQNLRGARGVVKRVHSTMTQKVYNSYGDNEVYKKIKRNKWPADIDGIPIEKFENYTDKTWPAIQITFVKNNEKIEASASADGPNQITGKYEWFFGEEFFKAAIGKPSNNMDKLGIKGALWVPP